MIRRLSGELVNSSFILVSLAAMIGYDTRLLVLIAIFFGISPSICQKSVLKMFLCSRFCDDICRFKRFDGLSLFSPSMGLDFTEREV